MFIQKRRTKKSEVTAARWELRRHGDLRQTWSPRITWRPICKLFANTIFPPGCPTCPTLASYWSSLPNSCFLLVEPARCWTFCSFTIALADCMSEHIVSTSSDGIVTRILNIFQLVLDRFLSEFSNIYISSKTFQTRLKFCSLEVKKECFKDFHLSWISLTLSAPHAC